MSDKVEAPEAPQTLEGWYMLHDVYSVDWPAWHRLSQEERAELGREAADWLVAQGKRASGDTAFYHVVTQKGDLMLVCYRESPDALNEAERSWRRT
ncbi:MAG: heme-dependent peroxidase, partial [Deltaproteobacteria bacterium]